MGSEDRNREVPPSLRVAGYVSGHAEHGADEEIARQAAGVSLPNIADYWPDAPHRRGEAGTPAAETPGGAGNAPGGSTSAPGWATSPAGGARNAPGTAENAPGWQILVPTTPRPTLPGARPEDGTGRRWLRPALLAGLLALVLGSGTVLLVRTTSDRNDQPDAAPPPPAAAPSSPVPTGPASVAPPPPPATTPPATTPTTAPTTAPTAAPPAAPEEPKPLPERVHFVLADGVTELSVRTSDLGDDPFEVSAAKDSGLDVDTSYSGGLLTVETESDGKGTGRLEVRLNKRIVWHLQLNAGVRLGRFDLGTGTVSRIDLDGGAERFDISLGRLFSTLPIRMTGGVGTWRIATAAEVPVKVNVGNGAGEVEIYGRSSGGIGKRETIRAGDVRDRPGLDIDAAAGVGSLKISRT